MKIELATAPVSWGVVMKDTPNVPPYSQVLDEMSEAGYKGTELGPYGYLPLDQSQLRDELDSRGLTLISAYVPVNFVDLQARADTYEEALTVVRLLSDMGCKLVTLSDFLFAPHKRSKRAGRIRPEDGLDETGWRHFIKNIAEFAKMCDQELGLKAAFHPHVGSWIETAREVDRLLEAVLKTRTAFEKLSNQPPDASQNAPYHRYIHPICLIFYFCFRAYNNFKTAS